LHRTLGLVKGVCQHPTDIHSSHYNTQTLLAYIPESEANSSLLLLTASGNCFSIEFFSVMHTPDHRRLIISSSPYTSEQKTGQLTKAFRLHHASAHRATPWLTQRGRHPLLETDFTEVMTTAPYRTHTRNQHRPSRQHGKAVHLVLTNDWINQQITADRTRVIALISIRGLRAVRDRQLAGLPSVRHDDNSSRK
jgi:hypothetical protein